MTIKLRNRNANVAAVRPNWSTAVGVEYSYLTSIFTARDGTEVNREAMRQRPRIALKFTTALTRPLLSRHQSDMATNQAALWAVRAEWAWVRTTADHVSPSNEIVVDEVPDWLKAGQQIIIETDTDEDLFTVDSVDAEALTVTLSDVSTKDYSTGAKVYLAYYSRAAASSDFTALTSRVWTGAVRYEVNPGEGEPVNAIPPAFTFGFARMFLKKPNWRESPRISFYQERDVFDPGFGLIDVNAPHAADQMRLRFGYTGLSKTDSDDIIAFFNYMKGRRTSFWMPTWMDDFIPSDDQIGTDKVIKIEGEDFRNAYEDHPVFQSVIAFYPDCTYQANTIASISGTTDSEVHFENDWSQEINSSTKMFWLVKCRFESDTLDVRWVTNEAAEIEFNIRTLPHDKTPDWPIPQEIIDLMTTEYELTSWGDMTLDTATPSSKGDLVDLLSLGITQEQIDAGDVRVAAYYEGTYQAGTPLADSDTQYQLRVTFHDSGDDGPASYFSDTVSPVGAEVNTFGPTVLGPAVQMDIGPITVPPGARWIQFRCLYTAAVTSNPTTIVSAYAISRPQTGSFAGTSLC